MTMRESEETGIVSKNFLGLTYFFLTAIDFFLLHTEFFKQLGDPMITKIFRQNGIKELLYPRVAQTLQP